MVLCDSSKVTRTCVASTDHSSDVNHLPIRHRTRRYLTFASLLPCKAVAAALLSGWTCCFYVTRFNPSLVLKDQILLTSDCCSVIRASQLALPVTIAAHVVAVTGWSYIFS